MSALTSELSHLSLFNLLYFFQFGKIVNEHYPLAEDGKTKGYTFLEFANHSSALEAVKSTNNYKLDKQVCSSINYSVSLNTGSH